MSNYLPHTPAEREEMLSSMGLTDIEQLFDDVPKELRLSASIPIPEGVSELEVSRRIKKLAAKNRQYETCFRGAGAYRHFIPAVAHSVVVRQEFVTAYTPYQAEISQGTLQSIFEYQTLVCELTGMDASNASVYDGPTAVGEAATMCRERNKNVFLVSGASEPQVIAVVETYCAGTGLKVEVIPVKDGKTDLDALKSMLSPEVAGVYAPSPNFYGQIEDFTALAALAHSVKAKFVAGVNPISLGLLKSPGECGADIACGEGQPLGIPLSFGGPYIGFLAAKSAVARRLPGRIVGETKDVDGKRAYVLTLQAREQHIRREKASSNICSNQALCALAVASYLTSMGPGGLHEVASQCYDKAHYAFDQISSIPGFEPVYCGEFFHEFVTNCPVDPKKLETKLSSEGILCGLPLPENRILWCATEVNTKEEIDLLAKLLKEAAR